MPKTFCAFRKQTRCARGRSRGSFFRFGTEKGAKAGVGLKRLASAKRPKPVKVHCRDLTEVTPMTPS